MQLLYPDAVAHPAHLVHIWHVHICNGDTAHAIMQELAWMSLDELIEARLAHEDFDVKKSRAALPVELQPSEDFLVPIPAAASLTHCCWLPHSPSH